MCQAVLVAKDDEQRVERIENFLRARWNAVKPDAAAHRHVLADWSRNLALRAASSGQGRSVRQMERRIKRWTRHTLRDLRGLARAEQSLFSGATALMSGKPDWSEIAQSAGYADQAHLCRYSRALTGCSPTELHARIFNDEGFWAYRLWGFSENALLENVLASFEAQV